MLVVLQRLFIKEAGNSGITTGALKNDLFLLKDSMYCRPSRRSTLAGNMVLLFRSVSAALQHSWVQMFCYTETFADMTF